MKILAVASGGGHWIQLNRLRPAFEGAEIVFVTTDAHLADMVHGARCITLLDVTRKDTYKILFASLQATWIVLSERPSVIVTTGAMPGLLLLVLGKCLCNAKTIWIDSIANTKKLSGSGRLVKRFADVRVSQWETVAKEEKIEYWGKVI